MPPPMTATRSCLKLDAGVIAIEEGGSVLNGLCDSYEAFVYPPLKLGRGRTYPLNPGRTYYPNLTLL